MQRRLIPILLAALAAVVVALVFDRGQPGGRAGARVVRVVDGDTIAVSVDGGEKRSVRLLGIDTPETHRPGTPIECGGPQASANMARLAPPGTPVSLEPDPTQDRVDRYGRLLAYVRLPDGRLAEEAQLAAGWATVYVFAGHPVTRDPAFRRAEAAARTARRGVWGRCSGRFHFAG
ncbi:MAG: micrococcal nuclease [Thermoleophilaceae bacterium]|jgi:micrococcal nuclease|nr:micrococcal nuclease [Thermoleophilaceae bacterium]MEA2471635.1 micrococcal nuclease [Thermoleophilaceae bacterium]